MPRIVDSETLPIVTVVYVTGMLKRHGLGDWTVIYKKDIARKLGWCDCKKKRIMLSADLMRPENGRVLRKTLLHEIAHALTPGHKHDAVWKAKAMELGLRNPASRTNEVAGTPRFRAMCRCGTSSRLCNGKLQRPPRCCHEWMYYKSHIQGDFRFEAKEKITLTLQPTSMFNIYRSFLKQVK